MELHESDVPAKLFDTGLLRRMLAYLKPYRAGLALAFLFVLPMAWLANYLPVIIRKATDQFLAPPPGAAMDVESRLQGLMGQAAGYLLLAIGVFFFRYLQGYVMSWIGQRILYDLRSDIFAKILRLPARYFDRNPVGRLMTRVGSDVEAIQRLLTDGVVGLSTDIVSVIFILGFMFAMNSKLTLIIVVMLPFLFAMLVYLNVRLRRAQRNVRRRQAAMSACLQELITGMPTVQMFTREAAATRRFDDYNRPLRDGQLNAVKWFSYSFPAAEVQSALANALMLMIGGFAILRGDPTVTLGVLLAFLAYIRDFFRPLDDLSEKSNILQSAMASAERVFGLMDEPELILDPAQPAPLVRVKGEVELDQVWFAYQDENWVLQDVSVKIRPGESVAIVGATGAGKSSLINLVCRFYDVQRGAVKVDGVDVRNYRQSELRSRLGMVQQDPFIFAGTLANNISLFDSSLSRERIEDAARYVNADGFIRKRPGQYDGEVMERGAGLSTGQKQLIALARAIAQDPHILLILDEATANVDSETERLIQDALNRLMHDRTSIVIAHRLSTIRHADRILVMRHGRIVEEGNHDELIKQNGYYRKLYDLMAYAPAETRPV